MSILVKIHNQQSNNTNAGLACNPSRKKRMRNHNWDSPRNLHFDVPKMVIAREKSMYLELAPCEGQSQCRATIPAFV